MMGNDVDFTCDIMLRCWCSCCRVTYASGEEGEWSLSHPSPAQRKAGSTGRSLCIYERRARRGAGGRSVPIRAHPAQTSFLSDSFEIHEGMRHVVCGKWGTKYGKSISQSPWTVIFEGKSMCMRACVRS
jgi:hypothetical protein